MDTYQGSIFEPVSLHKYLYANVNPVMNIDPSGNMTSALEIKYDISCIMIGRELIAKILGIAAVTTVIFCFNDMIFECLDDIAGGVISSIEISQTYLWEMVHSASYYITHPYVYSHNLPNNIPKGRKYQEAYAKSKDDFLKRSHVKLTFVEAIAALAIDINLNKVITLSDRFKVNQDKIDKSKTRCDSHVFGIYTHDMKNAAALAAVFGSDLRYGVHGNGLYHFRDGLQLTHI